MHNPSAADNSVIIPFFLSRQCIQPSSTTSHGLNYSNLRNSHQTRLRKRDTSDSGKSQDGDKAAGSVRFLNSSNRSFYLQIGRGAMSSIA